MHPLETRQPAPAGNAPPADAPQAVAPGALACAPAGPQGATALDAIPAQWPRGESADAVTSPPPGARGGLGRIRRLLPSPATTPFAFGYALLLLATSLYAQYGDRGTVDALLQGSSTDVAHLSTRPVLAIFASALWIAGGVVSPYAVAFVFVLAALEHRIGGWRTAGVFLLGHVVATLATEIPVALSVLAGHLPESSLHRLDYGISFGLMATVGALAGLLVPFLRWTSLAVVGVLLTQDLLDISDPLAAWGHPIALLVGIACWPAVRRVGLAPPG